MTGLTVTVKLREVVLFWGCPSLTVTVIVDDVLVEGIVDLAYETDHGMTVIDFKTDRAEGALLTQYGRQVSLYADAITRATGRPSRAVLMKV